MAEVVPTILSTNPDEYQAMLARIKPFAKRTHIDISDGLFDDNTTIGLAQVHGLENLPFDLHLMVKNPTAQLSTAISLSPNLIIFHAEADGDIGALIAQTRAVGIKAGVALLPQTHPEAVRALIQDADHVLVFTGLLGHNGGDFQMSQLPKIEEIRALKADIEISVDGGVTVQNAALIALQGIDVFYVGGYIQDADDPQAAYAAVEKQVGILS